MRRKKWIRKEYKRKKLIYEGNFSNGKRSGEGKKYHEITGKLMFEGDFLYGRKKKGKEYIKGNLEFEGEFLFNKKWNGKGYDKNNIEIYELKNGNGRVREYDLFEETLKYEGGYHNGKRSGQGQEFDGNKVIFSGEYSNGKRNGFGTIGFMKMVLYLRDNIQEGKRMGKEKNIIKID